MRKYIILFLFICSVSNAQYNLFAKQNFAYKTVAIGTNTEIGGVASTISTPALLATKLGIDVSRITNFAIVGSGIKCRITGSYFTPSDPFNADTNVTYYKDIEGLVSKCIRFVNCSNFIGDIDFNNALSVDATYISYNTKSTLIRLPNCTSVIGESFNSTGETIPLIRQFYLPNCVIYGASHSVNNYVFAGILSGSKIYVHPSMATINGGGVEADLAYAITQGAVVRYVTNFTAPNPITTLSAGTIYNTAIQLNFTPPSSTNTIDYYECYINGIFKNTITTSGEYITGLTPNTNYNITLKAVDIFYNKSIASNILNISTNTTNPIVPNAGLISYYKLESNSDDSQGINNGIDTSVSYVSGKISNSASYNGTSSKTIVGNPANLQLTNVSVSCWVKSSGAGSGDRGLIFKRYAYNIFFQNGILGTYSYGTPSGYKMTGINICDGTWKHIVITQQSGVANGTKLYINGVLVLTTTIGQTAQTDNLEFATIAGASNANMLLDETAIYNAILTQNQIRLIYNSGIGTTL